MLFDGSGPLACGPKLEAALGGFLPARTNDASKVDKQRQRDFPMIAACTLSSHRLTSTAFARWGSSSLAYTTIDAARRAHGLTVNSFASVSLDPPLVLWSQSKRAASHASFYDADDVATSILAEEHLDVATGFSKPLPDKFSNIELDRPPWALNAISRRWEAAVQTSWPWSLAALDSEGQVSK